LLAGLWLVAAAALPASAADPVPSRRDADLLKGKIELIAERSAAAASAQPLRTMVTEREVNAYLVYEVPDALPEGVVDPLITILGPRLVSARAVVDLDRIREGRKPSGLFDAMRFLTGRLSVTATGALLTGSGVARFQLESAEVGRLPIPKTLLQEIVSFYSRSPSRPSGFSLDDPVALPARIREVELQRGQAIVIQ
jgi:hypothetical protein